MPNNFQYIKLAIILLFVSISVISFLYRKFKEQQAAQEARNEALRRREQLLRTGRLEVPDAEQTTVMVGLPNQVPPKPMTVHDEARRRLQELAAQRRRELEGMARRAVGGGGPAPSAGQVLRPIPQPARPIQRSTAPPARTAPTQRPRPQTAQADDQSRRAAQKAAKAEETRQRAARQRADQERAARAAEARAAIEAASSSKAAAQQPIEAGAGALRGLAPIGAAGSRRPEDWRRAIVFMELLAPPKSMRGDQDRVF
ncbi:MAG: hypothetical protein ACK4WH_02120 [Phycisphaerales bacterium]